MITQGFACERAILVYLTRLYYCILLSSINRAVLILSAMYYLVPAFHCCLVFSF